VTQNNQYNKLGQRKGITLTNFNLKTMIKWISDSKLVIVNRRIDDSKMIQWEPVMCLYAHGGSLRDKASNCW
jgi:hypothetical protein